MGARIVLVSFLRRCSGDEVILSASTLGESFQVSMPGTASIDALSVKIREYMGFDSSTALRLVRADGQQLHMDMLVNSIPYAVCREELSCIVLFVENRTEPSCAPINCTEGVQIFLKQAVNMHNLAAQEF